eukprot:383696-Prorocentrum_minimum.AAC.1
MQDESTNNKQHSFSIITARSSGFCPPDVRNPSTDRYLEPLDRAKIIAIRYCVALLFQTVS